MGAFSLSHILVVALLALVLFGRGKVSELMGDLAKGIRSFKKSMAEDDTHAPGKVESRPQPAKIAVATPSTDA